MNERPNGAEYAATTRLSTRDDETLAAIGETCERLTPEALAWAIERGFAVPITQILAKEAIVPPAAGEELAPPAIAAAEITEAPRESTTSSEGEQ